MTLSLSRITNKGQVMYMTRDKRKCITCPTPKIKKRKKALTQRCICARQDEVADIKILFNTRDDCNQTYFQ